MAFGLKDEDSGTEKLVIVAESRETQASGRAAIAAKITDQVSRGLGLPPDRVELIPPGSIPKTSSGKLRRDETKQLYLAGTLTAAKPPAWLQIARLGLGSSLKGAMRTIGAGLRQAFEKVYGVYFIVVFILWIVPAWLMVRQFKDHRRRGASLRRR